MQQNSCPGVLRCTPSSEVVWSEQSHDLVRKTWQTYFCFYCNSFRKIYFCISFQIEVKLTSMIYIILFIVFFLVISHLLVRLYCASIVIHLIYTRVCSNTPKCSVSLNYMAVLAYSKYSEKIKSSLPQGLHCCSALSIQKLIIVITVALGTTAFNWILLWMFIF